MPAQPAMNFTPISSAEFCRRLAARDATGVVPATATFTLDYRKDVSEMTQFHR
jgi:hypothetical protein